MMGPLSLGERARVRVNEMLSSFTSEASFELETSQRTVFEPPPRVWIEERLATLQSVLEGRTGKSALLLREIFGPIMLEPVRSDIGRPYFRAKSELDVLALVEFGTGLAAVKAGANCARKWSQRDSNPCYRRERPAS